jgi:putative PIN family toxin of toxin-antitoxin system
VLDTNVIVSGLLWLGPPHQIFALIESGQLTLCLTQEILTDLRDVLSRPKFRPFINRRQTSVDELMASVTASASLFEPAYLVLPSALRDRDDLAILSCAIAAQAIYIVTGDKDLLTLQNVEGIRVVMASEFLAEWKSRDR